jgi:hypothetical protein
MIYKYFDKKTGILKEISMYNLFIIFFIYTYIQRDVRVATVLYLRFCTEGMMILLQYNICEYFCMNAYNLSQSQSLRISTVPIF